MTEKNNFPTWWQFVRDVILFVCGLIGIAWESLAPGSPDPSLLVVFGAMLGLPIFLRKDEK
jgi:hypothetical protein